MSDKKEAEKKESKIDKAVQELLNIKKHKKRYSGWYFVKSY